MDVGVWPDEMLQGALGRPPLVHLRNAAFGNLSENPSQISAEKQHIDRRYTFVCHGVGFFKSRRSIFGGTRSPLCGASQFWRPVPDKHNEYVSPFVLL